MTQFLTLLISGLSTGAIYAVFGACLTLWFRVCNVLNLAVGDFAMIGAIGTAVLVQNVHLPTPLAIVIVLIAAMVLAWLFDRIVLHFGLRQSARPGRQHDIVSVFFYTFALSLVLQGGARSLFGTDVFAAPPVWPGPTLALGSLRLERAEVLTVIVAVASGLALWAYLRYTVSGRAASACGESTIGSRIVGINSESLRRRIFVLTALLAALFGVIESPIIGFTYSSGASISLLGVVAAGFAAFRRPGRAVIGGLAIGVLEAFFSGYISTLYADVILVAGLTVIIMIWPQVLGRHVQASF